MQENRVARYPIWTIVCYQGAIWAVALVLVAGVSDLDWAAAALIAIAGTALTSAVALNRQDLGSNAKTEGPGVGASELSVAASSPDTSSRDIWEALDAIPQALLIIDRARDILWSNREAREMLGPGLAGRPLLSALRDPILTDALDDLWRTGAAAGAVAIKIGTDRDLTVELGPIGIGGASGALLLFRDIGGERRLEALRGDFIANVSHELKTPIAALLGFIETLRGPAREDAEVTDRFLGIMQDQASRMDRLVADLLSLSRIELREHAWPEDEVDLAQVLGSVADSLGLKIAARNMTLELPPTNALPRLRGAEDELVQVFQNLVENAIKYGSEGTPVLIEAEVSRDIAQIRACLPALRQARAMVRVTVRDQGQGIQREHLPRLTERFYRVDAARSREMGGTGLGLAIVKHILQRHRGTLGIESEPGLGSAFTVYLPVPEDS